MNKRIFNVSAWIVTLAVLVGLINPLSLTALAYLSDGVTETPSPIDNGETEIFTDECADFEAVFTGTMQHFQKVTSDSHRAWNDSTRINPKSVGSGNSVPDDRHLIYAAPNGRDIASFAFWMYFYGSGRMDMDIYVSPDNENYEKVTCNQIDPSRYEYESGKNSFYHRLFYLDDLDEGIKYVKLAWKNWGASQATEGHLGKVQLGYVNEAEMPLEIYGEVNADILRNTDKLHSFTGVEQDCSNPESFNFDSSRMVAVSSDANVVYRASNESKLTDFAVWTYFNGSGDDDFKFFVSEDGDKYKAIVTEAETQTSTGWLETVYYMENVPVGSQYLKIEFPEGTQAQLGQAVIGSSKNKFKVSNGQCVDLTANVSVSNRDSREGEASLIIAQYDNNEMICIDVDTENFLPGETKILEADISSQAAETGEVKYFVCSGLKRMTPAETDSFYPTGSIEAAANKVEGRSVTLSGILNVDSHDKKVNVLVLKNTTDDNVELSDIVYAAELTDVDSDGSFEHTFNMPASAISDYYKAYISGTDVLATQTTEILFINETDCETVTELINSAQTAAELEKIFEGTSPEGNYTLALRGMNINMDKYSDMVSEQKNDMMQMLLNERKNGDYTVETIVEFFNKAVVVAQVNNSINSNQIASVLANGNETFGFDDESTQFGAAYKNMTAEQQNRLREFILSAIPLPSPEKLEEAVKDATIAAYFNTVTYDEIGNLIKEYKDYIGISKTAYDDYSDMSKYNKSIVDKTMVGQDFKSVSAIKKKFEDKTDEVANPKSTSTGGGGSRGSTSKDTMPTVTYNYENADDSQSKNEISFTDLENCIWAVESIEHLASEGILSGYGDGTFKPEQNVKREEFVKMLMTAFKLTNESAESSFADVSPSHWSYEYISCAYESGIVNGYTDGRFGAGEYITREDMVVIAYKVLAKKGILLSDSVQSFNDSDDISGYAREAVSRLCGAGIISGMGDNEFKPLGFTTRAQAAKVIYGMMQLN